MLLTLCLKVFKLSFFYLIQVNCSIEKEQQMKKLSAPGLSCKKEFYVLQIFCVSILQCGATSQISFW